MKTSKKICRKLVFFIVVCMLLLQTSFAVAANVENNATLDFQLTSDVSKMFEYVSSNLSKLVPEYEGKEEVYLCTPVHSYIQVEEKLVDGLLYYPMITEKNELIGFFLAMSDPGTG